MALIGILLVLSLIPLGASENEYKGYQVIETHHLEIIFEPTYRDAALQVASFGDEVYETLKEQLEYKGDKRVPVVITGRTAWANGYFAPFPSRVTLFVTSDDSLFLGHRSSSWLYSLFTHELTHFLHLTNPIGPAAFLTPIFGPEVPNINALLMPGWWIEGITTNTESIFARGGRGDNERFAMQIKASLLDDATMWSLSKGAYSSILPPSGRIYLTGYLMLDYIIRNYEISSFNEINRIYTRFPFFGLSPAIKKVTGLKAKEIYQKALISFKNSIDENKGKEAKRITDDTVASFDMIDLINNALYATSYTLDKGISLIRIDSDGNQEELIARIPTLKHDAIAITRDGEKGYMIFQSADFFHPSTLISAPMSFSDIYQIDIDTKRVVRISENQRYYQVQLDENNNRLIALEGVSDRYRLVQLDLDTQEKRVLFDSPTSSIYFPQVHNNSSFITAVIVDGGTSSIVLYDGKKWTTIVGPTYAELRSPRFINESEISFVSDFDAPYALYSVNINTKEISLRYEDPIGILDGIITPTKTYYMSYRSTGESLFSVESIFLNLIEKEFPIDTPIQESWESNVVSSFEIKKYVDYPRFNLIVPLPFIEGNNVVPAAWTIWTSLLQKHIIQATAGYSFQDSVARGSLDYQYNPGPVAIGVNALYNEFTLDSTRRSSISTSLSFPFKYSASLRGTHFTQGALLTGYSHSLNKQIVLLGQIGHSYRTNSAPLDSFGRFSYFASYSLQDSISLTDGSHNFLSSLRASVSLPLPLYHQNMRLEVRNAYSHGALFGNFFSLKSILPPLYLTRFGEDGYNKTKFSLYYNIPIAPLDIPFLYGGINEVDISLHASTDAYINDGGFFFDDVYFFGATVSLKYALSVGANISPFIGFEIEATSGEYRFGIGITTDILYIGNKDIKPVL